ncbi:MAG: hypothetical protein GTO41_28875, partial [Burkholderiales bacterium]|nr:hypothetical protein [Burkholderiales bacterium]
MSTDGVTLTIDSTARRHWNRANSTALKVYGATTDTALTDAYTPNYVQGKVVFSTAHSTAVSYIIDCEFMTSAYLVGG